MAQRRGPDGSVRVAITGQNTGLPWANVFWCVLTGGSTATQAGLSAWTTAFYNEWNTAWGSRIANNVLETSASATLFQPGQTALHAVATGSHQGTNATPQVANVATAAVVSWTTNAYWRGGKPRTYIPGVVTTDITSNQDLTAAAITAWNNAADTWITGVNALSATGITQTSFVMMSFETANAPRPVGVPFVITGHQVHPRLGTQRRRLGKWTP